MKKFILTAITVLSCGAAYALPVGNPSDASLLCDGLFWEGYCGDPCDPCLSWCDAFSLRVGFYGDYVFNRHMERDDHDRPKDIERTEIYTNALYVAANFCNRFDLFTTLGASSLELHSAENAFDLIGNGPAGSGRFDLVTGTEFSWSLGVRGTLWQCGCTALGVEAQYFSTQPHIKRLTQEEVRSVYPAGNIRARYQEWQIGVGISHRIHMLVPYVAVKWARSRLNMGDARVDGFEAQFPTVVAEAAFLDNMESKKDWGFAVGTSIVDCEKASVTVEGRFADEKAFYVSAQFRL